MLKIYHNNRCSKSREALAVLEATGLKFEIVPYLTQPPSREQLQQLLSKLGFNPRQLLRVKETEYQQLGLADSSLSDAQIIDAMLAHPRLIERPIIESEHKAIVARPVELLSDFF